MNTIDIKSFSDQLHDTLKAELETIARENQELIARASKSLASLRAAIIQLKDFVHRYKFKDQSEEIMFFKEIKPIFMSQYLYYDQIFSIKINEPFGSHESIAAYYHQKLDKLQEFVKEHREFYGYCLSNSSNFDDKYFVRENNLLRNIEIDTKFSSGYDLILATILANQLVRDYLQSAVRNLTSEFPEPKPSILTWTGTKTGLIEIVYAFQALGVFNNGKADIKQVASSFESFFNISLGNWYRHFQEIRLRKIARTNFIDQMKKVLEDRLDELEKE